MRSFALLAGLLGSAAAAPFQLNNANAMGMARRAKNGYTRLDTSTDTKVVVTKENTLNGTVAGDKTFSVQASEVQDPVVQQINMAVVNNLGEGVNSYFSAADSEGKVFFLSADGSLIYPSSGGSAEPVPITENLAIPMPAQGETLDLTVPVAFSSGRLYFVEGELSFSIVSTGDGGEGLVQPSLSPEDPARDLNWGFVEMTLTETGEIWSNISYVDFIGIIMSMILKSTDGSEQEVIGLGSDGVTKVCEGLQAQSDADGREWAGMCITREDGTPLRVLSPEDYADFVQDGGFDDYWTQYVDEVWAKYTSETLTINTQADAGEVECQVAAGNNSLLECAGDNRGYPKPVAQDIWGCNSGPFGIIEGDNPVHLAVVPRLCAAFARSTLLIDGGNYQPGQSADEFYTVDPTFHYARVVHENQIDGKGYAFAYDDVVADGEPDPAGLVTSQNPELLTFFIGGSQ